MLKKGLNNGLIYMPYIPIQVTPKISEVSPRMSLKSRYATKIINSNLYGTFGNVNWSFKNHTRKTKIEKIFKIENPTE